MVQRKCKIKKTYIKQIKIIKDDKSLQSKIRCAELGKYRVSYGRIMEWTVKKNRAEQNLKDKSFKRNF